MGQTRYSRDTWTKSQLRDSVSNAPKYGANACALCERGRLPDDLTFKVSKYKTCGDVHLELSLIKPSQATCEAGQAAYRDLCCPKGFQVQQVVNKPTLSVAAGIVLFWFFTRRVRKVATCGSGRGADGEDSSGSSDPKSNFQRMKDDDGVGSQGRRSRKRSKSRDRGVERSRSGGKGAVAAKKQSGPALVTKTFKAKTGSGGNKKNILEEQQRRIQQEYMKQQHQLAFGSDEDQYYHLVGDDGSTVNNSVVDTIAGETIDAVITQVL